MKLELSIAADGGLVVRSPQPISGAPPAPSSAVPPATPLRDTGSCAPTRAHAIPSRSRYLARSRTGPGISSNVVSASQVTSRPVGPPGSLAGRRGLPSSLPVSGIVTFRTKAGSCSLRVFIASPHLWSADLSEQMLRLGGLHQFIAEIGMGEAHQSVGTLGRRKPLQIDGAELGHNIVGIDARRGHWTIEPRYDAGDFASCRRRFCRDDRNTALRSVSAPNEVELPAGRAVLMAEHMFGVAGAG